MERPWHEDDGQGCVMRPHVREVYSSDIDVDLYTPTDPHHDGQWIRFIIGPDDAPGEESFDVLICTPAWLSEVISTDGPQIGRHHLIVDPMDLNEAITFLRRRIESLTAEDWGGLAGRLSRIGHWEFEDYST